MEMLSKHAVGVSHQNFSLGLSIEFLYEEIERMLREAFPDKNFRINVEKYEEFVRKRTTEIEEVVESGIRKSAGIPN
jgi:hypothetical protein